MMARAKKHNCYTVYRRGRRVFGEKKRIRYPNKFEKRREARNFCRNRTWEGDLVIVHPDGTEEPYLTHIDRILEKVR